MLYDKQMYDMWITSKSKTTTKQYVLKLRSGNYVMGDDEDTVFETSNNECAFTFNSEAEAEEYSRLHWIDTQIEEIT